MLIVIDRGHGQKEPGKPFDSGTVFDGSREVDLTAGYIQRARAALEAEGHTVHLLDQGSYDDRHRAAIALADGRPGEPALYVQCHVNEGKGRYGLVEHDARSQRGRTAATCLADALKTLAEVPSVKVNALEKGERGWVCIDDIFDSATLCGVLYEPFFIDAPGHAALRTPAGLKRVGEALAEGVRRFAQVVAGQPAPIS
jgi:N-acetylmuramoyl-L-alanine amidase